MHQRAVAFFALIRRRLGRVGLVVAFILTVGSRVQEAAEYGNWGLSGDWWFAIGAALFGVIAIAMLLGNEAATANFQTAVTDLLKDSGVDTRALGQRREPLIEPNVEVVNTFSELQLLHDPHAGYSGSNLRVWRAAFVGFRNNPIERVIEADAESVRATLTYYDREKKRTLLNRSINGLWTESPPSRRIRCDEETGKAYSGEVMTMVRLSHLGIEALLYLLVYDHKDKRVFAVDSEWFGRHGNRYEITETDFLTRIQLTGHRIDQECWIRVIVANDDFEIHHED